MDNKNVLIGTIAVLLIGGGVMYSSLSSKLSNSQDKIQQLQTELDNATQKLQSTESVVDDQKDEIDNLTGLVDSSQQTIDDNEQQLVTKIAEIRQLQNNLGTVSKCLTGVVDLMDAYGREDSAGLLLSLVGLEEPCEQSEEIIQEVENFEGSSES